MQLPIYLGLGCGFYVNESVASPAELAQQLLLGGGHLRLVLRAQLVVVPMMKTPRRFGQLAQRRPVPAPEDALCLGQPRPISRFSGSGLTTQAALST